MPNPDGTLTEGEQKKSTNDELNRITEEEQMKLERDESWERALARNEDAHEKLDQTIERIGARLKYIGEAYREEMELPGKITGIFKNLAQIMEGESEPAISTPETGEIIIHTGVEVDRPQAIQQEASSENILVYNEGKGIDEDDSGYVITDIQQDAEAQLNQEASGRWGLWWLGGGSGGDL